MNIQPADTKRIYGGAARCIVTPPMPGLSLRGQAERHGIPVDAGIGSGQVGHGWDGAVMYRQRGLDEAGHTSRFKCVSDIALHTSERNLLSEGTAMRKRLGQRRQFRCVADLGRRGMRLDILHVTRLKRMRVGPPHGDLLPFLERRPEALAAAIGSHSDSADDTPNPIAVSQRPGKSLNHEHDVSFGSNQPVRILVEGARYSGGDTPSGREEHEGVALAMGSSAHDRHVDFTELQSSRPQCQSLQRGSTSRIHNQRWTVQPIGSTGHLGEIDRRCIEFRRSATAVAALLDFLRNTRRNRVDLVTCKMPQGLQLVQVFRRLFDISGIDMVAALVAPASMSEINTGLAVGHLVRIVAGVAQSIEGHFAGCQVNLVGRLDNLLREPALRVVKRPSRYEAADCRVGLAAHSRFGIVIELPVQNLGRKLARGISPGNDQPPEFVKIIGSRQSASHAYDCQRLVFSFRVGHSSVPCCGVLSHPFSARPTSRQATPLNSRGVGFVSFLSGQDVLD